MERSAAGWVVASVLSIAAAGAEASGPIPDGTYTGPVSFQFNVFSCSPPGQTTNGIVGSSGTATLVVNGNRIDRFDIANDASFASSGTQDPDNLMVDVVNEIASQNTGPSNSLMATLPYNLLSDGRVEFPGQNLFFGSSNCSWNFDYFTFVVELVGAGDDQSEISDPTTELVFPHLQRTSVSRFRDVLDGRLFSLGYGSRSLLGPSPRPQPFTLSRVTDGVLMQGQSAGDGLGYPWGVWASGQYSDFEDDFPGTAFDADRAAVTLGADVSPWENFVIGVAVGYEAVDVDSAFNAGEADIDTFTVVPYVGGYLSDQLGVDFDVGVDFAVGFSWVDIDQFRTAGGARVTSETDSDRWFAAGNLNVGSGFGNLYVNGTAGLLFVRDNVDGFTESDGTVVPDARTELGQLRLGTDVSYAIGAFSPFATARYELDYEMEEVVTATGPQPANDDDQFRVGLGLRYFGAQGLSGGFEWNRTLGREDFDEDNFSLQLRAEF